MSKSKFSDDEIEKLRREATKRRRGADPKLLQMGKDFITAAYHDEPDAFRTRLKSFGINPDSEQGQAALSAYWTIRRTSRR